MRRTAARLALLVASVLYLAPATVVAQARLTGGDLRGTVADPVERLRLALRARLQYLLSKDAAQVILYDWRALKGKPREEMIRLRDRYEAFWSGLVYEAAGSGRLRPDLDLKMLRFLLLGAVNSVAQWYSPRGQCGPAEVADAFWEFLAFGVLDEAHRPSVARRRALEPALVGEE